MKAVLSVVAANVKLDQRPLFLMVRISSVKTATRILILPSALVVARSVNPIILTYTISPFLKAVISEGLTYQNQPWHMHCFVCTHCKQSLTDVNFTSRADKPYCETCVGQHFGRQCFACTKHIAKLSPQLQVKLSLKAELLPSSAPSFKSSLA